MKTIVKLSLAVLAISAMQTQAATTRIDGDKFDVIYDTSLVGLFGTPKLVGDTFYFTPVSFSAKSVSGAGWDILDKSIVFTVVADAGHHLGGATLVENGDYGYFGKDAFAAVAGELRAVTNLAPKVSVDADLLGADELSATKIGKLSNWTASASQTFQSGVTSVDFTIENLLFAYSEAKKDYAFIEKKYIGLTVSAVPEAETWAMMLGGLGMIGVIARRRINRV